LNCEKNQRNTPVRPEHEWELEVGRALAAVSRELIQPDKSFAEIAKIVLDWAKKLTDSDHGYVSSIDPQTKANVSYTLTEMMGKDCRLSSEDMRIEFPVGEDGKYPTLWGHALNTRESFYTNDPASHPMSTGLPEGHVPMTRFLSVPAVVSGILKGQIALANSTRDYTDRDLEAIKQLAAPYGLALQRKRAEVRLARSEERYKLAQRAANIGSWDWDIITGELHWSETIEPLFGFGIGEFEKTYEAFLETVHPEDRQILTDSVTKCVEQDEEYAIEHRIIWPDGTVRWMSETGDVFRDGKGRALRMLGVVQDITEKKLARQRLDRMFGEVKKSHDDYLSILNMMRVGILVCQANGRATFANEAANEILNLPLGRIKGKHWSELIPFEKPDNVAIEKLFSTDLEKREKIQADVLFPNRKRYRLEIELRDDPRNQDGRIFFLYDMSEVHDLRNMLEKRAQFGDLTGKSSAMQDVFKRIREVATVDWTVLIEGETGTGKELVASAIHYSSPREAKPFITVNCAGLTDSLLSSQLFGHKKGAFSGAIEDHRGFFEEASGGTLFLDEIGDISPKLQLGLLRVLEAREINRVGESRPRKVDARILVATNKDIQKEVDAGVFRADLLYRIRVARLQLPPLRERREDIPLLAASFLDKSRVATGKEVTGISAMAMNALLDHHWPGNVRELKTAIEFATLHCAGDMIEFDDLPPEIEAYLGKKADTHLPQANAVLDQRQRILLALEQTGGNRNQAAQALGISRATLFRRLAEYGITKPHK
jgi:PAS domain S-box-containing protein